MLVTLVQPGLFLLARLLVGGGIGILARWRGRGDAAERGRPPPDAHAATATLALIPAAAGAWLLIPIAAALGALRGGLAVTALLVGGGLLILFVGVALLCAGGRGAFRPPQEGARVEGDR